MSTAGSTSTTALDYGQAIEPYDLFWYEEIGDPLDYHLNATVPSTTPAHRHGREPVLPAGRPQPDPLRRHAPRPRHHPGRPALGYGLSEYLRIQDMLRRVRLVLEALHPSRWSPVLPAHRSGAQTRWERVLPGRVPATGGFADDAVVDKSRVGLTDTPGIGFESKAAFHKVLRALHG